MKRQAAALLIAVLLHAALLAWLAAGEQLQRPAALPVLQVQLLPASQPAPVMPSADPPAAQTIPRKTDSRSQAEAAKRAPRQTKPTRQKQAAMPMSAPEIAQNSTSAPVPPTATLPGPVPSAPPSVPAPAISAEAAPVATGAYIPAEYAATNRRPAYPALSRRYGEEGTVVLRVLVTADGSAGQVVTHASSGYPLLDQAAREAVREWRFQPATRDGKPVADWFLIPIPFKLHD